MALGQAQIPTPPNVVQGNSWASIWTAFTAQTTYLRSLVLYLQKYLGTVQGSIVPLQFAVSAIANSQSPYAVQRTDVLLAVSAGVATATVVSLPQATGSGRALIIAKVDSHTENVDVAPNGTDTINGTTSVVLSTQYNVVRIVDAAAGTWLEW